MGPNDSQSFAPEIIVAFEQLRQDDGRYRCPICNEISVEIWRLLGHIFRDHTERGEDFICPCGYGSLAIEYEHELSHHLAAQPCIATHLQQAEIVRLVSKAATP